MTARLTMAALIARLRLMTNEPAATSTFTDDQFQDTLDERRLNVEGAALATDTARMTWQAPYTNLEGTFSTYGTDTGATLYDVGRASLFSPTSINYLAGTFTFSAPATSFPYLFGFAYDLNGAAADMWLIKASQETLWKGQFGNQANAMYMNYIKKSWPRIQQGHKTPRPRFTGIGPR